ncbi:alpha-L-fucosidase [Aliidiomarina halalkaliphila]|uniref:Alpha-L-fucosidase n=1 Tax=Aliidiomarina halalkaliphila TaxID=2593535 RepID=A0A552WZK9_9GAMM|nr:amidoligase family protein [Aliidiomarina halalkaliphila]TRW48126.1 alpha-L-fucosidase [Aliidiomarina halalkaliphila]
MAEALIQVPRTRTADDKERRVGVEIELGALSLDKVTEIVEQFLTTLDINTETQSKGRYEREISGDDAGPWIIEFDYSYLKKLGREEHQEEWQKSAEKGLAWIAESVVPVEIVSPPLPLSRLKEVENLMGQLRDAGARGSSDSLAYAFGMQLNPEVPDTGANTLVRYLQAFLCSYDWLLKRIDPDISRRVSSYIDPFPKKYLDKVLDPDYAPSIEAFMDDYLKDNPTRNRALDMLPLFRHLDEERVVSAVPDDLIKARPTFHYRLPGCEIHRNDWGLFSVWNDWAVIEQLAESTEILNDALSHYQRQRNRFIPWLGKNWKDYMSGDIIPQILEQCK